MTSRENELSAKLTEASRLLVALRTKLNDAHMRLRTENEHTAVGAYEILLTQANMDINDILTVLIRYEPDADQDGPITATIDYEEQAVHAMADGNIPAAQALALLRLAEVLEYGLAKPAARSSQLPTRYAGPAHPENVAG